MGERAEPGSLMGSWGMRAGGCVVALYATRTLGFTPLPPLFFAFLLFMVVSYLALVEMVKRRFYGR